jgi:hypothetical protein
MYESLRDYSNTDELRAEVMRNWNRGSAAASGSSADGQRTTDQSNDAAAADPPVEESRSTGAAAGRQAKRPKSWKAATQKQKPKDPTVT